MKSKRKVLLAGVVLVMGNMALGFWDGWTTRSVVYFAVALLAERGCPNVLAWT